MGSIPVGGAINSFMKKLAVFLNHPECSVQSAHGIIRALSNDWEIDCIGRHQLRDTKLKKYDLLAVPGGLGDSDTWHEIMEPFADVVLNYLSKGKRYLGICMGAYWAGSYYLNILKGVEPVQYIKRPGADIRRSFGTITDINWLGETKSMYFYDGCAFLDQGGDYSVIARYANLDPAAIIQNNIGLIGPHPESDIYWYSKTFMQPHWHEYRHHKLLQHFVQQLIKK